MITLRPRFNLDGDTVTRMVAREEWDGASDYGHAEPRELTRRQVEEALVDYVQSYGWSELDDWATNLSHDDDELERIWAWARRQVLRVWPELTVAEDLP
jgi:hypothetical protein